VPTTAKSAPRVRANGGRGATKASRAVDRARCDRRRIATVLVAVVAVMAVIAVRIGQLQFVQGARWRLVAQAQSRSSVALPGERGTIFSREGMPLAITVPRDEIFADPMFVQSPNDYARSLAPLLGVSETVLLPKLKQHRNSHGVMVRFEPLAVAVPTATADRISAMAFPGLYIRPEPQREYPAGDLGGPVIGLTVPGQVGASGLEYEYQQWLAGHSGLLDIEHDQHGVEIPGSQHRYVAPTRGRDLVITLDEGIQYSTEHSLLDQVIAQHAHGGMAVVIDTVTGDVLAMASVVGASQHQLAHIATAGEANSPVTFTYNPGSVMKIVPVSKALDSGCITTSQRFHVADRIKNGRFVVRDDENHAPADWTARDILTESSNVGTTMIANQCFDSSKMANAVNDFGFGRPTALHFPREAAGLVLRPEQYYDTGVGSTAIGYSPSVTPMQLLDAYTTIARGGVPIAPRLVSATIGDSGVRSPVPVNEGNRVVSAATAAAMRDIFSNVVRAGTGACAAVPGYEVAGKTGTVQKHSGSQFVASRHMASFVGFAPAQSPRLAAVVVLDEPANVYGARAAAPVFSEIMSFSLQRMHITPPPASPGVAPQFSDAAATAVAKGNDCAIPHGAALVQMLAKQAAAAQARATAAAAAAAATTQAAKNPTATKPKSQIVSRNPTPTSSAAIGSGN
jgi:cell division protein FtsI/penicillin-binding protein 2